MVKSVDFIESGIVSEFLNQRKDIPEGTIVDYLMKCFPDSCFARNYADYKSAFTKILMKNCTTIFTTRF